MKKNSGCVNVTILFGEAALISGVHQVLTVASGGRERGLETRVFPEKNSVPDGAVGRGLERRFVGKKRKGLPQEKRRGVPH